MVQHLYMRNKAVGNLVISELPAKLVDGLEVLSVEEQRTDNEIKIAQYESIRSRPR